MATKKNWMDDFALVSTGKHVVQLKTYEANSEKNFLNLEFRDAEDVTIEVRLYSGYIPTFMAAINAQTKGAAGQTLKEMLKFAQTNSIDIWTYYDDYGLKASYFPPKA